jgi:membrane-bound lytic murein transglycosylase D
MKYTFLILVFVLFSGVRIYAQEKVSEDVWIDSAIVEQLDVLLSTWYAKQSHYQENSQRPVAEKGLRYTNEDSIMVYRLQQMTNKTVFPMVFNNDIKAYINMYIRKRRSIAVLLGLAKYYFPFFEQTMDKYNCPLELKYLAVIESALNPMAVSRSGATGLWQFMYNTGKMYGLEVSSLVDYRCDPLLSTDAAARHLSDLSKLFMGDWVLAMAAYNCGAGNVKKAIIRSGGKTDFWEIYDYLPKETRGYIPAFYGAWYVMQYYDKYGIEAEEMRFGQVDTFLITNKLHLQQVSSILSISLDELKALNPQYKRSIIPPTSDAPMYLILPVDYSSAFELLKDSIYNYNTDQFFSQPLISMERTTAAPTTVATTGDYRLQPKTHTVKSGESLSIIARIYKTSVTELAKLNKININTMIHPGKKLIVSYTKIPIPKPKPVVADSVSLVLDMAKPISDTLQTAKAPQEKDPTKTTYITYRVEKGDTLTSIVNQFQTVSVAELRKINQLKEEDILHVGQSLKIPVQ